MGFPSRDAILNGRLDGEWMTLSYWMPRACPMEALKSGAETLFLVTVEPMASVSPWT